MLICGIDPGITGALAFIDHQSNKLKIRLVVPMPTTFSGSVHRGATLHRLFQSRGIDWDAVTEALHDQRPDLTVVEEQWARPKEGVSSAFKQGVNYGGLLGVLAGLRLTYETVYPSRWKNAMGLRKTEKDASRLLALKMFPQCSALLARKKDHGLAEALLIATWKAAYEHTALTDDLGPRSGKRFADEPAEPC